MNLFKRQTIQKIFAFPFDSLDGASDLFRVFNIQKLCADGTPRRLFYLVLLESAWSNGLV